jgi:hypothetical protein
MRLAFPLLALAAALAACTSSREVTAEPPTVAYQVTGSDTGQAGLDAQHYCDQYHRPALVQGFAVTASGDVAVYTCSSAP